MFAGTVAASVVLAIICMDSADELAMMWYMGSPKAAQTAQDTHS